MVAMQREFFLGSYLTYRVRIRLNADGYGSVFSPMNRYGLVQVVKNQYLYTNDSLEMLF